MDVVLRVLRGDDLDVVSCEVGLPAAAVSVWQAQFMASSKAGLKSRAADGLDEGLKRLKALVGDDDMARTMREAVQRLRGGPPFVTRMSTQ